MEEKKPEEGKLDSSIRTIAHEMRGPLIELDSHLNLLLSRIESREINPDELAVELEEIRNGNLETITRVNNFLELVNKTSGDFEVKLMNVNMKNIVDSIICSQKHLAAKRGLMFEVSISNDINFQTDPTIFRSLILNIVNNAVKYTFKDSHIEIYYHEIEGCRILAVRDYGPGIELSKKLPKENSIFSSGIGSNIIKEFSALLDYELQIKSEMGFGTLISIKIPRT